MTKSELRKLFLQKRAELSKSEVVQLSERIAQSFFENVDLDRLGVLHTFIPIHKFKEFDTSLIYKRVWQAFPNVKTVCPRVNPAKDELENFEFRSEEELIESAWGIREPQNKTPIDPSEVDVVIVPTLCFDRRGHRLGYGKGYYDKFLAECRPDCRKLGVNFFDPIEEIPEIGPHDIALDACLTPDGMICFPR